VHLTSLLWAASCAQHNLPIPARPVVDSRPRSQVVAAVALWVAAQGTLQQQKAAAAGSRGPCLAPHDSERTPCVPGCQSDKGARPSFSCSVRRATGVAGNTSSTFNIKLVNVGEHSGLLTRRPPYPSCLPLPSPVVGVLVHPLVAPRRCTTLTLPHALLLPIFLYARPWIFAPFCPQAITRF
jgi:hypothetical protein